MVYDRGWMATNPTKTARPAHLVVALGALGALAVGSGACRRATATVTTSVSAAPDGGDGCGGTRGVARGEAFRTASGRTFHVWTPTRYDGRTAYPLVIAYHGYGTDGRAFQSWFKMEDHVEDAAIVVYPNAKGGAWDLDGARDLDFFDAVVDAAAGAFCVDRARVHAFGFSFGAKMVHHLGCKRPGRLRAIAAGDGSWAADEGCGAVPVLVTHRTRDDDELLAWGRGAMTRWVGHNGCAKTTSAPDALGCVGYDGCAKPVVWCEDTFYDPTWKHTWNHTVREEHRDRVWAFFRDLR